MKELQIKIAAVLALAFVFGSLAEWFLLTRLLTQTEENAAQLRLQREGEFLKRALIVDDRYKASFQSSLQSSDYAKLGSGRYYSILIGIPQFGQQHFKSASLGDQSLPVPQLTEGAISVLRMTGQNQQPLLVLSQGATLRGLPLTISVGEDIGEMNKAIQQTSYPLMMLNGGVFLIMLPMLIWVTRRAFKPLGELQGDLEEAVNGGRSRDEKRRDPDPSEILRLVLLATQRLERSRSAISSLTHLLKTPLAAIVQIANSSQLNDYPEVQREIITHTDSILTYVQSKLRHAQMVGSASVETLFNPSKELQGMILALKAIYREKSIKYEVSVPDVDFLIDRQDCLELIGNLLDNASKWAKGRIRLEIKQEVNGFFLRVEDDGPGCSEAEIKILSQPGMWLNERNAGHGLGMSLMHNIAKLYGGTIHFGRSSLLGGLSVSFHLKSRTVDPITRKII